MTEEITIGDLINKTVESLLELGLATHTVWNSYGSYYLPIVKFHKEQGNTFLIWRVWLSMIKRLKKDLRAEKFLKAITIIFSKLWNG